MEHLAPVDRKDGVRYIQQPDKAERDRRREVLMTFHKDMIAKPLVAEREFDMEDFMEHTQEDRGLYVPYSSLIRNNPAHFERVGTGLYRAVK